MTGQRACKSRNGMGARISLTQMGVLVTSQSLSLSGQSPGNLA